MAFFWKLSLVSAVLLAFSLNKVGASYAHSDYKLREVIEPVKELTLVNNSNSYPEFTLHGQIYCNKSPIDGVRPFIESDLRPEGILAIDTTSHGGLYRLTASVEYEKQTKTWLVIRHQCPIESIPPMKQCATPYYWTEISIDLDRVIPSLSVSKPDVISDAMSNNIFRSMFYC
ncbi:hypothetical protein GCK72_026286 [Caenorhabditis remanei]|uniref:Uncharacterized protein n=1 Tax=Caenorhabditis remanei TaxID=31234 RepID=A0A6A5G4D9_CAERE|nr:hypothetical protein GCK72_026286 [Caenorhabditis remanei]KAF1749817.1 hypothetical protein GCK72_026286 [Caenorhabditis remanei]